MNIYDPSPFVAIGIEEILDQVELALMRAGEHGVARACAIDNPDCEFCQ